jgi:RHS repeat-associated protein
MKSRIFGFLPWFLALSHTMYAQDQNVESISSDIVTNYVALTNSSKDAPPLFVPDQLATLTHDANQLIGGIISPLSGNPCLRETDLKANGAQEIHLSRVYIAPYMPHLFHKHLDADDYYRRRYLGLHYEGWKFFPHQRLWYTPQKNEIHLVNPSGATYDFNISGSTTTLLYPYAVSNVGDHEIPSGRFDPRNTRITYENNHFTVFSPDGSTRHYHPKGNVFQLAKEVLPNGRVFKYHYTDLGTLSLIESLDPKEQHVYASIRVQGSPLEGYMRFIASTGLTSSYTFESRAYEGKFREGHRKIKYSGATPPLLLAASTPHYRNGDTKHTEPNCLFQSYCGKNALFTLSQAAFGDKERAHFRVDQVLLPVGQKDAFIPVYQMHYQPAVAGEREGKTTVKNSDGTFTVFQFSKNLLTTSIQYFGQDKALKKEKIFTWNDKNWLAAVEWRDGSKQLFLKKSYEYDGFGNPVVEIWTGDLQGTGKEDSYRIKRAFSQDGRNLLIQEETEEGKVTAFEYLPDTNLVTLKLTKEGDRILVRESFQYDAHHNLIQKSIDDGNRQKIITDYILRQEPPFLHMPEWIEEKYLDQGKEKLLKRTHLKYDPRGNVAEEKIYDAEGVYAYSLLKEYNERGDILSETNPLGQTRTFAYDEKGRCIESTNFSQKLKEEMCFDAKGRLVEQKEIGAAGVHTTTYAYDCKDDLIQKIDTYGNIFSYSYDPLTRKITRSDAPAILTNEGQAVFIATFSTYDPFGREISKSDANGNTTLYRYNAYGLPVEITYPNGSQELFLYTKSGKIASHTNREGLTIVYTFDALGRLTSKDYGQDIGKESYVYDSFNLLKEVDLDGNTTHYLYDGAKRKIREETNWRITEYAYDALGRLSTIGKDGLKTHFKRDLADRVLEECKTDAAGVLLYKISYSYTEDGALASVTRYINGKEATESFAYDAFKRETEHQDPFGNKTITVYNENHVNDLGQKVLQVTTVDPKGIAKIETNDPFLRVVQGKTLNPQDTTIACWDKIYDPNGNVTYWKEHVYEEGHYQNTQCTHFTYTSDNKVASSTRGFSTPESRTTYYIYMPGGKVAKKTLPDGIALSYAYDALGFLRYLSSSDNKIRHRFTCTKNGEVTSAVDEVENITIQREIDPFGNVIRELFPNNIEIKKSYDFFDRMTLLHISNHGSISYTYDPLYLRSVSRLSLDGKLQYSHQYENYDLAGNPLSENMILGCGKAKHGINLKGQKTEISSPYFSQQCLYDSCDNLIKSTIDQIPVSYTYDDLAQLISENKDIYRYNSLFNRRKKDDKYFEVNYLNELVDQTYDLNGNLIQKGDAHYVYDPLNRLIKATVGTKRVHFLYDPLGRRLAKIVLDKTPGGWVQAYRENYLYNGYHEIGALAPDGTLKNLRVLGLNMLEKRPATVAIELNKKVFSPVTDVQGNICRLVNPSSRSITGRYAFSSFGEVIDVQKDENPWRYAARRFDPELHLIYDGERYYDPELARWLTTDPAGFAESLNLYHYAFNNPYKLCALNRL